MPSSAESEKITDLTPFSRHLFDIFLKQKMHRIENKNVCQQTELF